MKIDPKVQDDIITEMFLERDKLTEKFKVEADGSNMKFWLAGMVNGMSHAMGILSAWNEPNHGKVRAGIYKIRDEARYDSAENLEKRGGKLGRWGWYEDPDEHIKYMVCLSCLIDDAIGFESIQVVPKGGKI